MLIFLSVLFCHAEVTASHGFKPKVAGLRFIHLEILNIIYHALQLSELRGAKFYFNCPVRLAHPTAIQL